MITSSKFYPFGGKVSTVETPPFRCMISTAKAGFFKKQSVLFTDVSSGVPRGQKVAELFYKDLLDKDARLALHDTITQAIDESGMSGLSLTEAIAALVQTMNQQGVVEGLAEAPEAYQCSPRPGPPHSPRWFRQ